MALVGVLLMSASLVLGLAASGDGANIGAGMVLLLGIPLFVIGLLVVVLDAQYVRRRQ
jgi:serine acetyltransferase